MGQCSSRHEAGGEVLDWKTEWEEGVGALKLTLQENEPMDLRLDNEESVGDFHDWPLGWDRE